MAEIAGDIMNILLERGFQGTPLPIIPTLAYRRSQGNALFYQTDSTPQSIYNLGDAYGITQGLYVINQEVWQSTVTVESDDNYNTFNSIKLVVNPSGGAGNVDIYAYMMNGFTTTLPVTEQTIDIQGDIQIGTDLIKLEGNMHLTLLYVDFDGSTSNVLRLALHCDNAHYYSASGSQYDFDIPNYCILMGQTQFIKNQPWAYLIDQGDPDWYSSETQVPPIGEGGGGGGFYRNSDSDWFSALPSLNILSYGFISQYKLSQANAVSLSQYLWSDNFIDNLKKAWQSPFDNIISLAIVPLNMELPTAQANIKIGNLDSGITSDKLTVNLVKKNFGYINLKEIYKNFADYAPFTRLNLYLPAIGVKSVNPDDYMDGELHLEANIDTFSGTIVYQLGSVRHGKRHIVDHYEGSIVTQIPITGASFIDMYKNIISGVATVTSGAVMGSALAVPIAKGATTATKAMHTANQATNVIKTGESVANGILNIKPTYEKTGSVSGSAMRLSMQTPYLFFDTPQLKAASAFRELHGYVSNQYEQLKNCKGFTSIKYMDIRNIDLTDDEKSELEDILTSGVYIN